MYLRCKDLEVFDQRSSLLLKMRGLQTPDPKTPAFTASPVSLKIPSMFDDHALDDHALMVPEMFSAGV